MQRNPTIPATTNLPRRTILGGLTGAVATAAAGRHSYGAPSQMLRIAMTASDLPTVTGIPNNGGEGYRFLGYPAYDGVVNWDYTHVNQTADATPGLFEVVDNRSRQSDPLDFCVAQRRYISRWLAADDG